MDLTDVIIFDSESDGFVFEATKVHVISTIQADRENNVVVSYYGNNIEAGLERLAAAPMIVCHNIAKHDIPLFQKLYPGWEPPPVIDTLVLSALLNPERLGGHGIEAWARRMGGEQKVQHETWDTFDFDMLKRCESDARLNKRVFHRLLKECYSPIEGVDMFNFDFGEHNP